MGSETFLDYYGKREGRISLDNYDNERIQRSNTFKVVRTIKESKGVVILFREVSYRKFRQRTVI